MFMLERYENGYVVKRVIRRITLKKEEKKDGSV